jgi:hypothetical protein
MKTLKELREALTKLTARAEAKLAELTDDTAAERAAAD